MVAQVMSRVKAYSHRVVTFVPYFGAANLAEKCNTGFYINIVPLKVIAYLKIIF
jgi:hypothetical protein